MNSKQFWGLKTFCIVTGASQGIGRCLAVEFSKKIAPQSKMILIARSEPGLKNTQELIKKSSKDIVTVIESLDLSKPDINSYKNLMKSNLDKPYDVYLLIHNAGSEGNGQLASNMSDINEWQAYMNLNLFSVTLLTSAFLDAINILVPLDIKNIPITIINITSLAAKEAFPGLGYYCIGKSAREMYFRTLASENPDFRILNYSPGPIDTNMIGRVIDKLQIDETKNIFVSMKEKSTLLTVDQTIARLIGILEKNQFISGGRIDYFEEE